MANFPSSNAKRGIAMADGSFPIASKDDIAKAIKLAGDAKNPTAARQHIMRRARALGAKSAIPITWL